jgi:hypothetical protein
LRPVAETTRTTLSISTTRATGRFMVGGVLNG